MSTAATMNREVLSPDAKRSMFGGIFSLVLDSYDIYLPAFVLPAAMGYFEPASMSASTTVTLTSLIFTVTLLARPIGGPIFGNLSDRIGRKRATMIAAWGFTITTFLMALIPGYKSWGYGSISVLIALRLIDGAFLGGGYAGPVPLAIERSPKHLRALVGGLVAAGAPVAVVFINLVNLLALDNMARPAFLAWGWRLPFLFGSLLGVLYIIYYSRVKELDVAKGPETRSMPKRERSKQPIGQLLSGRNLRNFLQVLLLMSGMWFAAQMALSFMPGLLIGVLHQKPSNVGTFEIVTNIIVAGAMILWAVVSQKIGRRTMLLIVGFSILVGEPLAFLGMIHFAHAGAGFGIIAVMAFFAFLFPNAPLGTVVVYLNERFPANIRGSGYGTAYTISLILPGLYSTWLALLGKVMPYAYTALVLVILGGVLFLVATVIGPETRDVELLNVGQNSEGQAM